MKLYPHIPQESVSEHREITDELDELDDETEEALREFLAKRKEQLEAEKDPESPKERGSRTDQERKR